MCARAPLEQVTMSTQQKPRVYLLGTGGTIATQEANRKDSTEYSAAGIRAPLDRVPEAEEYARVKAEQFINVARTSVEIGHWLALAKRINEVIS